MTPDQFIPLGGDLPSEGSPKFVRLAGDNEEDDSSTETPAVTPAEANDLPGQIRQILQKHLSGADLEKAAAAIQSSVDAAPARVILPEIKLTSAADARDEAAADDAAEPGALPTIELVREENVVRRVIVNCTCGQSIQLACDY